MNAHGPLSPGDLPSPRRICILTFGSLGDVLPLAKLGQALARRGHHVTVWCGELHLPMVERLGVEARPLHLDAQPLLRVQASPVFKTPQMWRRVEQGFQAGFAAIATEVAALPAGAPRPIVVASTFALAGRLAQEKLGLKLATVHLSPICLASFLDMPPVGDLVMPAWVPRSLRPWIGRHLERLLFDPVTARGLNAFRATLGLAPIRNVLSQWMHSPDLVLALFPPWFGPPQPDWPPATQVLGFPLADAADDRVLAEADPGLETFLNNGPPPVVFYPGSAKRNATAFFDEALRACARLSQRAVFLTRYPEFISGGDALPPWALQRAYVPLSGLLPRSAALVHCGGVGTLAQAVAAGCPQLLLPYYFDHFDNARHLRRLGLAHVHRGADWGNSLERLLADAPLRTACQASPPLLTDTDAVMAQAAVAVEALA